MITRMVKVQLLAFAVITALGVGYVGAEYVGLTDQFFNRGYTVKADFADSGGIYSGAEVTYRGVPVGRVGALGLESDGVLVELHVQGGGPRIPADTVAVVADRSAVGEQYVDLQPRAQGGPYLHDGVTIARGDTRTPLPTTQLMVSLDRLVNSVGKSNLKTTVDELGKAFAGSGPDLTRLVDSGNALVESASAALPQTIALIENSRTVLRTQVDEGSAIKGFSRDLAALSDQLRTSDPDLRKILDSGVPAAQELDGLLKTNRPTLAVLLGNLVTVGQIEVARLPGLRQILVTYPVVVAGGYTVLPGDGTAHFGLVLNAGSPPPCTQGYDTQRRTPQDTAERPANTNARCDAARGSATDVRGAQNAPAPGGGSGAYQSSYGTYGTYASGTSADGAQFTGYDPATGSARGPDGQPVEIGSTGGEQSYFGKDSWQWMLVGPMA
jgi:phospholipid/cholesterol/gamma-HCH transport system substrate-binding protein